MTPWPLVRSVEDREEVDSTSDLARALLLDGRSPLPLLVRARRQTKGRGQGANAWWSDPGSLTFTLAVDPSAFSLKIQHHSRLALAAAVAVVGAVAKHVSPKRAVGIRWPNDIESGGRKLGGILPERVETPHGVRLLIGIGLNVRTSLDQAPPEVRALAASLAEDASASAEGLDPERILGAILAGLASVLPRLAEDDPSLAEQWAALDLLLGRAVRVDLGPRILTGVGAGIDPEGALLVATDRGTERLFGGRVLRDV